MIRVVLIRHGRTAWNPSTESGQRFRGLVDLPLASQGVAQAEVTARRLAATRVDAVYASPLQRAVRTGEILAAPHGQPVQVLPGLTSMDYGEWAGLLHEDVARRWPELYGQWRRDPFSVKIPGGESAADLRDRAVAAVHEIVARHSKGERVLCVTHQVVAKTLVCALAGLPNPAYWRVAQDLCNLTLFDFEPVGGAPILAGLNDTCHFSPTLPGAGGNGTRVVLVRHGQTAWNLGAGEERFRGRTDLPLDEVGHAQAQALATRLHSEPVAALYASPLLRARQTLAPLADALGMPVQTHEGLLDINYGHWQGLTHQEVTASYPELAAVWRASPAQVRFPGGEGLSDVQERFQALLKELVIRHPGQTVVLVGHQMVNKAAVCTLLGMGLDSIGRIQQDPCALDVFQYRDGAWHCLRLNDTYHLSRRSGRDESSP